MRGKQARRIAAIRGRGITPACAGKTIPIQRVACAAQDHPRVCGENDGQPTDKPDHEGSPPRVRGKQPSVPAPLVSLRITPACAGKTRPPPLAHLTRKDHPRVCGENDSGSCTRHCLAGSPPRVRGKPGEIEPRGAPIGITPACAGKTFPAFFSFSPD